MAKTGYTWVQVHVGDGFYGCPEHSPYDRIVVSTCASDISPLWLDQLALHGWALVPLKHGGKHPAPSVWVAKDGTARVCDWAGFGSAQGLRWHVGPWYEPEEHHPVPAGNSAAVQRSLFPIPETTLEWLANFYFSLALNEPNTAAARPHPQG